MIMKRSEWLCLENENLENVVAFRGTCIWLEIPLYAVE